MTAFTYNLKWLLEILDLFFSGSINEYSALRAEQSANTSFRDMAFIQALKVVMI